MKEKLSFLALALCLGLVITFVLAACSGGGGTGSSTQESSSSGTYGGVSSNVQIIGILEIDPFEVYIVDKKVIIGGTVTATQADPVAKLEFLINNSNANSNWISYQGEPVNGLISVEPKIPILDFAAEINLKKDNIPCEEPIDVTVKAYNNSGKFAMVSGNFTKPSILCPVSSSSGEVSSSSVAVWRFGGPEIGEVFANTPVPIGSGTFELAGDADNDGNPDVRISGGKIRPANPCKESDMDDIKPGEPYSSGRDCLGSTPATVSKLSDCEAGRFDYCVAQTEEYDLIYLDDGSIYLIQFKPGDGKPNFMAWPKKYMYWLATEKPN